MTLAPETRRTLPLTDRWHGNRSTVTCQLRCGNACFHEVPNQSDNETFHDIATAALSRRSVLLGAAGALVLAGAAGQASSAAAATGDVAHRRGRGALAFEPIASTPSDVDAVVVPKGYRHDVIIRWGDPLFHDSKPFDVLKQTGEKQARQFGYNCDYLNVFVGRDERKGLLVCNHEYTNENIMFPTGTDKRPDHIRAVWEAHGMSVVELRRRHGGQPFRYVVGGSRNRRITLTTPFRLDGPAAGSSLVRTTADPHGRTVFGTMNNCSGGVTPWGTVLSGEENIHQYFHVTTPNAMQKRYGIKNLDERGWRHLDERWDTDKNPNEPNRFGWIIEIDPQDPDSTPVKHTAMGRFKHEGANVIVSRSGHVVAYMGDDERFEYLYKFVSREKYRDGGSRRDRRHNKMLLSEGDLYVGQFNGEVPQDDLVDGGGEWIPLTRNGKSMVTGFSLAEVLVYTRAAADKAVGSNGRGATKMDRPEDVEPNLHTGFIYAACTNNSERGNPGKEGANPANPRTPNKDGHILEIREKDGDHTGSTFTWNLPLICGMPGTAGTYFGGYTGEVSPISCPDNVAFDSEGTLWVSTDGAPGTIKRNDGLFKVPLTGPDRGRVQQFLSVPVDAETCGPVIHDSDGSVFVCVQHPGEEGTWDKPTSHWPDFHKTTGRGKFAGPRPSVVQVTRQR